MAKAIRPSRSLPVLPSGITKAWRRCHCAGVLARNPQRKLALQTFLCTDKSAGPEQILAEFIRRWQIVVTIEEARAHPGMETQRQWSDRAIACTTGVILPMYPIVTLTVRQLVPQDGLTTRHAAWYAKDSPTFSDTIAFVYRSQVYGKPVNRRDMLKIERELFDR